MSEATTSEPLGENIRVVTRIRPMPDNDPGKVFTRKTGEKVVDAVKDSGDTQRFEYDAVIGPRETQEDVYNATSRDVLDSVLRGYNGAVIAYGQTGSGKTHTITGTQEEPGLIPRLVTELFAAIRLRAGKGDDGKQISFQVSLSYVQLYKEQLYDMLDPQRNVKLQSNYVSNASNVLVEDAEAMEALVRRGNANRIIHQTKMNDASSRSHSVLLVTVVSWEGTDERASQLYLVDLAGSESINKTGSQGATLEQAKFINCSLLSLRRVIQALVEKKSYVPYRDSILSNMLRNALGGNSKTTMIICVSPSTYNRAETVASLRFGMFAGSITNVAKQNVMKSTDELVVLVEKLREELESAVQRRRRLEAELAAQQLMFISAPTPRSGGEMGEIGGFHARTISPSDLSLSEIPENLICPLSKQLMVDPVILADGFTYDRAYAERYLTEHGAPPRRPDPTVPARFHHLAIPHTAVLRKLEHFLLRSSCLDE